MRKKLALILALSLVFTLCACGGGDAAAEEQPSAPAESVVPAEAQEPAEVQEAETEVEEPVEEPDPEKVSVGGSDADYATAAEAFGIQSTYDNPVITLTGDCTAEATLEVTKNVTLDLNGYTLALAEGVEGSVITAVSGGTLTVNDSSDGAGTITGGSAECGGGVYVNGGTLILNGGTISGNSAKAGGGVHVNGSESRFEMNGGLITGNTAEESGGGVRLTGGTFLMTDGSVSGNSARSGGGMLVNDAGSRFEMTGGVFDGNTSEKSGGGIYFAGGTFEISGGKITNNLSANEESGGGGGFYYLNEDPAAASVFSGGEISGNSGRRGGGIYIAQDNVGKLTLCGSVKITGNIGRVNGGGVGVIGDGLEIGGGAVITGNSAKDAENNLYAADKLVTIGEDFSGDIGVTVKGTPTEAAPVAFAVSATEATAACFSSDNAAYVVRLLENGAPAIAVGE